MKGFTEILRFQIQGNLQNDADICSQKGMSLWETGPEDLSLGRLPRKRAV